jgi:predicted amidophosphoribosyltransferase
VLSFPRPCAGCGAHAIAKSTLCRLCQEEAEALGQPLIVDLKGRPCLTLSSYSGFYRRMILRAKVRGDHAALAWLETWSFSALDRFWRPRAAASVIACPSSFWGRLRGRLDVAGNVAATVAERSGARLLPAPYQLFWRTSKRAHAQGVEQRAAIRSLWPASIQDAFARRWAQRIAPQLGTPILLLDDVITSGRTLLETAEALPVRPFLVALTAAPGLRRGP